LTSLNNNFLKLTRDVTLLGQKDTSVSVLAREINTCDNFKRNRQSVTYDAITRGRTIEQRSIEHKIAAIFGLSRVWMYWFAWSIRECVSGGYTRVWTELHYLCLFSKCL